MKAAGLSLAALLLLCGFCSAQNGLMSSSTFQWVARNEIFVLTTDGTLSLFRGTLGSPSGSRQTVDANVRSFQGLTDTSVVVLGKDGKLWLETLGNPTKRQQVDANVSGFVWSYSPGAVFVLGTDGNLWLEHAPFGKIPPLREQVDGNVRSFQDVGALYLYVLGSDGKLWSLRPPYGSIPPDSRSEIDDNVRSFYQLFGDTVFVLSTDGNLWLEHPPFGQAARLPVGSDVRDFQPLTAKDVVVLLNNGTLWLKHAPFVPWKEGMQMIQPRQEQIDGNVCSFLTMDQNTVLVLGDDGKLWMEHGPFGQVPPPRELIATGVAHGWQTQGLLNISCTK